MTQGVTLIAIGDRGYFNWACNMACSIKYHSPKVKIQLITEARFRDESKALPEFFDILTVVPEKSYTENGALFPAKLKLSLYEHLYFDETIYLDVDGCVLKDIAPLFDCEADLAGDVQGVYDRSQEGFIHLKWCKPDVIWPHYGLKEDAKLPAINSSFMFIRKSALNAKLFKLAYYNLMAKPIPYESHWHNWGKQRAGKIKQPDELYFDVAMAQLGIIPKHEVAVYFRLIIDEGKYLKADDIRQNHYAIGLFGDLRTNHLTCREIYDKEMGNMWRKFTGKDFYNKSHILGKSKFVNA